MKNISEYIAAIDIGTTKIVTIIGKKNENSKLEIIALSHSKSTGVKRGLVMNIEDTVISISQTLKEIQEKNGITLSDVFVGIAGQHIRSIRNRGYRIIQSPDNEILQEDLKQLLKDMHNIPVDAGEEILHVIPQNYIVDNEPDIRNPVGMIGKRLEGNYHIVIGNTNSAKNIEKCIRRVNLKLNKLILEPLASSASVLTNEEKEAGVALIDIGGGTTDLAVYYEGIVWHTAVVPFGGNVITKDIKEGCSILPSQAENLKIQCGTCLIEAVDDNTIIAIEGENGRGSKEINHRLIAGIINARMEEILDAISFEIESSGIMDKLSAGIVVTGGGSMLRDLPQLINYKTGMDVRIGYPCEQLAANTDETVNNPMYATAIGLVLEGIEYFDQHGKPYTQAIIDEPVKVEDNLNDDENEIEATKPRVRLGLFDNIKKIQNRMMDIFEENDAKME